MTHATTTISKAEAIEYQLGLVRPETVAFAEGGASVITPARWVPELSNVERIALDGVWEVARWPFPLAEKAMVAAGGAWDTVTQPGKVLYYDPDQSPHTIPHYNRATQEHHDPEDGAIIRRTVVIPHAWAGRRILLRFEGIYPAGRIYWDDAPVAEQGSGLTPIEIDVTDRATPGARHQVAVRLYRRHTSIRLDMPRHAADFAGLCRAAFLHAVEPAHFSDLRLLPELADDNRTGIVRGEVAVRNTGDTVATGTLQAQVRDTEGTVVVETTYAITLAAGDEVAIPLDVPAGAVQPWNDERPYLYTLALRLLVPGQMEQRLEQRIGFRRFVVRDGRATLNGRPVKFRGVNHLTFHPDGGMYTPEPWLRQSLMLMKRANVNAIRTHFFSPRELVDLCDELGVYLLQELPIDWGHPYLFDPVHLGPVLHRMEACVRRDRNHPSVMVWSIGNENMARTEEEYEPFMTHLRLAQQMVKRMDPTRPTMFPPPGPARAITGILEARMGEIADIHYSFKLIREFNETGVLTNPRTWGMYPDTNEWTPTFETHTREELVDCGWSGVWFSSEYGIANMQPDLHHAPYAQIIADVLEDPLSGVSTQEAFFNRLSREWGYMRDDPGCLGGAYFPWIAAGGGDPWGWVRWAEDSDWGVVTGDLLPKSAFWIMRALFSPVRFPARAVWKPGQTELTLEVRNGFNAIDLDACILRTQMGGGPPYLGCMGSWRDVPMAGAPGTTATVTIPLWNNSLRALEQNQPVVCRCTLLAPDGHRVIMTDILVVPAQADSNGDAVIPIGPDVMGL